MRNSLALALTLVSATASIAFAQQPTPLLTQTADQLVAVLKSDGPQKQKVDACRQLAVLGTKESVAALAALLPDEQLNHMARYALETIPDPAVDKIFRDALATLAGRPLVGVIGSIGVRKDAQAVPPLAQHLQDANRDAVQAAARALGRIATPAAVEALTRALPDARSDNQLALCEGLLRAAESCSAKGDRPQALAIAELLLKVQGAHQIRTASVRAALLVKGRDGIEMLRGCLQSDDYLVFAAGVRTSYELPGPEFTEALCAQLPRLSDDNRKRLVIQALGRRPEAAAIRVLSEAAKQERSTPVRIAAIQALGETGNTEAAPRFVELLNAPEPDIAQAALESMAGLQGKRVDQEIEALLKSPDPRARISGIELVGRRRMAFCLPELMALTTDADAGVRPAALSKVGELGGAGEIDAILKELPKLRGPADLDATEQALGTLCAKEAGREASSEKLTASLAQADVGQKGVLLRVLSGIGSPGALAAIRAAVNDPAPEVHDAAIRALGAWKSADAAPDLLALAKTASTPTDRTLCLRSYLGLAANPEVPAEQRLHMCREASQLVKSPEEKRLLLGALGSMETFDALTICELYLDDSLTRQEASAAVLAIAGKLLKTGKNQPAAANLIAPLEKVAAAPALEAVAERAKTLLEQARKQIDQR